MKSKSSYAASILGTIALATSSCASYGETKTSAEALSEFDQRRTHTYNEQWERTTDENKRESSLKDACIKLPSYLARGQAKEQNFWADIHQWGQGQTRTYPNTKGRPWKDARDNFRNALDNLGNGADVAYSGKNGCAVLARDNIFTFYDAVTAKDAKDDETGKLKWGRVPVLGPAARYIFNAVPRGFANSTLRFTGEFTSGLLNITEGIFRAPFVDLGNKISEGNIVSRSLEEVITFADDTTHATTNLVTSHIAGGHESGRFVASIKNGILRGNLGVDYQEDVTTITRILDPEKYAQETNGAEVLEVPNTAGAEVMRAASVIGVNSAIAIIPYLTGSSSSSGSFIPGEGDPVGTFNPGPGGNVGN